MYTCAECKQFPTDIIFMSYILHIKNKLAGKIIAMATKCPPNPKLSTIREHGASSDHQDAQRKKKSRERFELIVFI